MLSNSEIFSTAEYTLIPIRTLDLCERERFLYHRKQLNLIQDVISKRMNSWDVILYTFPFSTSPNEGSGVERYAYQLVNSLPSSRIKINTISKAKGSKIKQYFSAFTEVPLKTLLSKTKIYHAVSPYSAAFLFLLHRDNRPIITSVHDVTYLELPLEARDYFSKRRASYNINAIQRSDKIIVPFQYTKRRIKEVFGVEDEKIVVIKYGIDLTSYFRKLDERSMDGELFDVLFLGGVNPLSRGSETVLKTYKILKYRDPKLRLAISGTGTQMDTTISMANQLGLSKDILWLGFIPEAKLPELIKKSRVFFYPTKMGFSLLMMQAMASSVPIVTSNVFDTPEFVGDAAINFGQAEIDKYADAIFDLIKNEGQRLELIKKGNSVISSYSPKTMASEIASVYKEYLH